MVGSPAVPTGRGGTHGGTLIGIRKYLEFKILELEPAPGRDYSVIGLRLRGMNVAIIALYLDDQKDHSVMQPSNVAKLTNLLVDIKALGLPFLIGGDLNLPPQTFAQLTTWLDDAEADIVAPPLVTCTSGRGRTLDYLLVSRSILPLVTDVGLDPRASWSPHVGLEVSLDACPKAHKVRKLVQPPPLLQTGPSLFSFAEARIQAEVVLGFAGIEGPPPVKHPLLGLALDHWGGAPTAEYARWSRAVELQRGLPLGAKSVRGQRPLARVCNLVPAKAADSWTACPHLGACDAAAVSWSLVLCLAGQGRVRSDQAAGAWIRLRGSLDFLDALPQHYQSSEALRLLRQAAALEPELGLVILGILSEPGSAAACRKHEAEHITAFLAKAQTWLAARSKATIRQKFKNWAMSACTGGASKAHMWTKGSAGRGIVCLSHDGLPVNSPLEMMQVRRDAWSGLWCKEALDPIYWLNFFVKLRSSAAEQVGTLEAVTGRAVVSAIRRLPQKPTRWADGWTIPELQQLHDEELASLAEVLNTMERELALPEQGRAAVVGLIPKPTGGERPICVFSLIYQLWGSIRFSLASDWDDRHAGHWDDAIKGSCAQSAGMLRALLDELAAHSGLDTSTLYVDLAKFYDSISLTQLAELALKLQYPSLPLLFSLQAYMGQRFLRSQGCVSLPILPTGSIGAGCRRANSLARVMLHEILAGLHVRHPMVKFREFVDDLVARCEGTSRLILSWLPAASADLVQQLTAKGLQVSYDKSVVAGSSPRVARAVHSALARLRLNFRLAAGEVKDLGVGQAGGTRRRTRLWKARLSNACKRGGRALRLKFTGAAPKLIATGAIPTAAYGAAAGVAPKHLHRLRSLAARAVAGTTTASCKTTSLALSGRLAADPGNRLRAEALVLWIKVIRKVPTERLLALGKAWEAAVGKLQDKRTRWATVVGPLGATVATLLDLGWVPLRPGEWVDELGDTWNFTCRLVALGELKTRVLEASAAKLWASAVNGRHGADLAEGACLAAATMLAKEYSRAKDYSSKNMLTTVLTGGSWTAPRIASSGKAGSVQAQCYRCGSRGITDWHVYWECPTLAGERHPDIIASAHLVPEAKQARDASKETTFWLRGLARKGLTHFDIRGGHEVFCIRFDPLGTVTHCTKFCSWQQCIAANREFLTQAVLHAYTDGSGGKGTSDRRYRTCGWGVVFMLNHFTPLIAFCGELPGLQQTVPRAELAAAEFAVKIITSEDPLPFDRTLELHADCSLVCRGLEKGEGHCLASPTLASAWGPLWAALRASGGALCIKPVKVRAHSDKTRAAFQQQEPHHTFGNMVADTLAGRGAAMHELAEKPAYQARAIDDKARLVMRRLVAITLQDAAANPRQKKGGKTAKAKRETSRAARPRWLYQRRRGTPDDVPLGDPVAAPAPGSPHEGGDFSPRLAARLEELFSPDEAFDDEPAWGLFSPEDTATPLALEPQLVLSLEPLPLPMPAPQAEPPQPLLQGAGVGEEQAAPERLSRAGFATQADWHLEVARRSLLAKGHFFIEEGTFFGGGVCSRAPQCERCLTVFPRAKVHSLARQEGVCTAVACTVSPPLVQPQRLVPRRVLRLGTGVVHESHTLGHFRGRLWCVQCTATVALTSRLTSALSGPCPGRRDEETARRNVERLAKGELPTAWRSAGWPKGTDFALLGFS
jgi:hypothetical protein